MYNLISKEISSFLSSLAAYVVIGVFLLANGVFLWLVPGNDNILDGGYADMSAFFNIAPRLFLFLIPAICMRLFAEERRSGTIDLLLSRPLGALKIVLSKFFAAFFIVMFALVPTLIYFLSIYLLACPVGNVDTGAIMGSYMGLLFLSSVFVAVSLFASALSDNQILAFMVGLILCFLLFSGFDFLSSIPFLYDWESEIQYFGISSHYSPMSRGVLDSRDVIWFVVITSLFVFMAKKRIEKY